MFTDELSYYAEISILVDGWPWNLSEYDFRAWFAPGSCPQSLLPTLPTVIAAKKPAVAIPVAASGNRRSLPFIAPKGEGKGRGGSRKQKKRDKRRQAA